MFNKRILCGKLSPVSQTCLPRLGSTICMSMIVSKSDFWAIISYNYKLDNFCIKALFLSPSQHKPPKKFQSKLTQMCVCLPLPSVEHVLSPIVPNPFPVQFFPIFQRFLPEGIPWNMLPDFYFLAIPVICSFQDEALELYCIHPYPPDYFQSQIAVPDWYARMTSHLILTV